MGRAKVESLIKHRELLHINEFVEHKGIITLFYSRLLPIFPGDLITIIFALTEIRFSTYLAVSFFAAIPGLILQTIFGNELRKGVLSPTLALIGLALTIIFLIYVFGDQIKKQLAHP